MHSWRPYFTFTEFLIISFLNQLFGLSIIHELFLICRQFWWCVILINDMAEIWQSWLGEKESYPNHWWFS